MTITTTTTTTTTTTVLHSVAIGSEALPETTITLYVVHDIYEFLPRPDLLGPFVVV